MSRVANNVNLRIIKNVEALLEVESVRSRSQNENLDSREETSGETGPTMIISGNQIQKWSKTGTRMHRKTENCGTFLTSVRESS